MYCGLSTRTLVLCVSRMVPLCRDIVAAPSIN